MTAKAKPSNKILDEHNVKDLTTFQLARLRLEMYLGSRTSHDHDMVIFDGTDMQMKNVRFTACLLTAFREIFDNAMDAIIKGNVSDASLKVNYDEDNLIIQIEDTATGIPIDYVQEYQSHLCTLLLTRTGIGSNYNDAERKAAGANGVGGSIVSQISEWVELEVHRKGKPYKDPRKNEEYDGYYKFTQRFTEGNDFFPEVQVEEPKITKIKTEKTGTNIKVKLSKEVVKNTDLPTELLKSVVTEIAASNPNVKFYFNGEKIAFKSTVDKNLFGKRKIMSLEVLDGTLQFDSQFFVVPNAVSGTSNNIHCQGLVNNIPALEGGTHLETFKKGFALGIINALEKEAKRKKLKPNRTDIEEGLLIYNITKMNAPFFSSQTKTRLINEEVIKPIQNAMSPEWFAEVVKKNKEWVEEIFERCAERTNRKDLEEDRKAAKKLIKGKVAKLRDATSTDRTQCTLFLAEGDSAISSMLAARDSKIHGILPLRGKILNVNGQEKTKDLMDSEPLKDMMVSLNLIPGVKAERENMRYGQIYISTDSDQDGYNIASLLCNFFYKFWPELFADKENPFIYIFTTPFIILEKGKETKYFYGHEVSSYNPDDWKGWKATRAKGLGTLEVENFRDAIDNGYIIPIIDDGKMMDTLDLVFNKSRADDRKDWMKY